MQLTLQDLFKMWETLDNSGPLTDRMQQAKEHLELHLSTLILDLKLNMNPQGQANG